MSTKLLIVFTVFFLQAKSVCSQTADSTIVFLNAAFAAHSIGATNFSFKKISDNEIVATNSVTVRNFGSEKLTYRFNPKSATTISFITSKNRVTITFSFKENSVEWFDRYMKIEPLSKIQCSLVNITPEESDGINKAYRHLIKLLGGNLKDEEF
jgi:hypothetical protein